MQRNVAGGCGKVSVVVAAAVALSGFVTLVPGRLRQLLRFLLKQLVERLLHAAAHEFLDLPLDYFLV